MEEREYSIALFFLVTGFSFLLFSMTILWLDGENIRPFNWAGIFFILVGGILSLKTIKLNRKNDH